MMQRFLHPRHTTAGRPSFLFSSVVLVGIMLLYSFSGAVFVLLIPGGVAAGYDAAGYDHSMVVALRIAQVAAQILVLALPVLMLARMHAGGEGLFSPKPLEFLGMTRHVSGSQILFAVLGMLCLQPLLHSITELQDLFLWPSLGSAGQEILENQRLTDELIRKLAGIGSFSEALAVAGVLALTPACCEEVFFRGYLQQNYYRSLTPAGSVFFTGFVFAVFHLSAANLVPLALLGWYIGYIFMKSGSLVVPFTVHLINNLLALYVLYAADSMAAVLDKRVVFSLWWWVSVAGGLLLFVFFMRRFRGACS